MEHENNWEIKPVYPNRKIENFSTPERLMLSSKETLYTVVKCTKRIENIHGGQFYSIKSKINCCGADYRLFAVWYDAKNNEYAQDYIKEGVKLLAPKESCSLDIEVLICSDKAWSFSLSSLSLEETEYVSRRVRIFSVAHEMIGGGKIKSYEENIENVRKELDIIGVQSPDLIVLTECVFHTGISKNGYELPNGEPTPYFDLNGADVQMLCSKAAEYHSYIVCSVREKDEDGILHNTGLLINRSGKIQGKYYKSHLTSSELEEGMPLKNELPVFDTDFGKLGILICWDYYFLETTRILALKGAEVIAVPTHGFHMYRAVTRAEENGVYFVTSHKFKECSVIMNPNGQLLSDAQEKGYAFAEVDLNDRLYRPLLSCDSRANGHDRYMNERRSSLYERLLL